MNLKNKWIVVQGVDGSGKTTIVNYLNDRVGSEVMQGENGKESIEQNKVVKLKACGSGEISSKLRELYVNEELNAIKSPVSSFMHVEHYTEVMKALAEGKTVISDRWLGCYYAYNYCLNSSNLAFNLLDKLLFNDEIFPAKPDILIQLLTKPEIAKRRLENRKRNNSLDNIRTSEMKTINNSYMEFLSDFQDKLTTTNILVIVNNFNTEKELLEVIDERLGL